MSRSTLARDATLAALPAIAVTTILLAGGLINGPTLDGSVFALIGDGLLHGRMPYLDLWDHKPPGVYLVNAGAGVILPFLDAWSRAWLASWLSTIAAVWLIAWVVRREGVPGPAVALALLGSVPLCGAFHFALGGGQTESVGLGFAMVAVALVAVGGSAPRLLLAGLAVAAATLISLQFAPLAVAMLALLAVRRTSLAGGSVFLVGAAIIPVVVVGWLASTGALADAIDQVWTYNRIYLANNQQHRAFGLRNLAIAAAFVAPVVIAAVARLVRGGPRPLAGIEVLAGAWLGTWVAYVVVQGLVFDHYVTSVAPAIAIPAAGGIAWLAGFAGSADAHAGVRRQGVAIAAVTLVVPLIGIGLTEGHAAVPPGMGAVREEVAARTDDDDAIFVWGNEPRIYLETRRWPAGPFSYMFPLTTPGYGSTERSEALVGVWESTPPALIVDATTNSGRVGGWPIAATSGDPTREDATLDPLRSFVADHYVEVARADTWVVLALDPEDAP